MLSTFKEELLVMRNIFFLLMVLLLLSFTTDETVQSWIRINQLGYTTKGIKVAVCCSKENISIATFELIDSATHQIVYANNAGKAFGAYGPFKQTYRLTFSAFTKPGKYYIKAGNIISPVLTLSLIHI